MLRGSTNQERFIADFIKLKSKKHTMSMDPHRRYVENPMLAFLSKRNAELLKMAASMGYTRFTGLKNYVIRKENLKPTKKMEKVGRSTYDGKAQQWVYKTEEKLVSHTPEPTLKQYLKYLEGYYFRVIDTDFHEFVCTKENKPIESEFPKATYEQYRSDYELAKKLDEVI